MFPSVRSFLAFSYTLVVLLIISVLGISVQVLVESRLRHDLDADLQARATELAEIMTSDTDIDPAEQVALRAAGLNLGRRAGDATYIRLYSPNGVAAPLPGSVPPIPDLQDLQAFRQLRSPQLQTVQTENGMTLRVLSRRVVYAGQTVGYLQVARDLAPVIRITSLLRNALIYGGALAGAGAGVVSFLLAYQALKPFSSIVEDTRQIGVDDLHRRLPASYGVGEVSRLAQSFNSLLDRLQKAFDLQRRFVADASHELRTPLTSIRGNVDVLLLDPELAPATREALQGVSAESARLSRLITNLLLLARADAGQNQPAQRPVDLHALVLETVRQSRSIAGAVEVRLVHEDQVTVTGDSDALKQVILNLLDNALKYTPDGGYVHVSIYRDGSWAKLEVHDNGIGIPTSEVERIFDRFYRADKSPRGLTGSGLGLSIVRSVVETHGGKITLESTLGQGSIFTVWLPVSNQTLTPA